MLTNKKDSLKKKYASKFKDKEEILYRIVVYFLWSAENNKLKRTSALMGPGKKFKK